MLEVLAFVHRLVDPGAGFVAIELVVTQGRHHVAAAACIGQRCFDTRSSRLERLDENEAV